jgi:hypothetical protein
MKKTIQTIALTSSLALNVQSVTTNVDSLSIKERLFQFSVIHPMGSNGLESAEYLNVLNSNMQAKSNFLTEVFSANMVTHT